MADLPEQQGVDAAAPFEPIHRDAVRSDLFPFVRSRLPLVACACVLGLAIACSGVGLAAYRSIRLQTEYSEAITAVAEIPATAGRIDALVAELADPRTDPARYDRMRSSLTESASRLQAINSLLCPTTTAEDTAPAEDSRRLQGILCVAVEQREPSLPQDVADYASAGTRAARPGADLAPGALLRGDLDGEYESLVEAARNTIDAVHREQVRSLHRWRATVLAGVIALLVLASTLAALVLGPLAELMRRNRIRERNSIQARLQSAAYITQVINSIDVGVIAVDESGQNITMNAAARSMLGMADHGDPTAHMVFQMEQLWLPEAQTPLAPDSMPLAVALGGSTFPPTELRLLPGRHSLPGPRSGTDAATAPGPDRAGSDGVGVDVSRPVERRVVARATPLSSHDGRQVGALATFQDVTQLHLSNGLLIKRASELSALSEATRAVLRDDDARSAVCQAAATISGATVAGLFEPAAKGDLVCSSAFGAPIVGLAFVSSSSSVMAEVFASGRARTTSDVSTQEDANHDVVQQLSVVCGCAVRGVVWVPVATSKRCLAVLALAFTDAIDAEEQLPVLEILAAETASAIERQDLLSRLAAEAGTDPLTGTANRRAWEAALAAALDDAASAGRPSVIMLDIDHFKIYNDTYGHPAGDQLLRRTAQSWRDRLRSHDLLARYGGEEFIVLLPGCARGDAAVIADGLRSLLPQGQTCSAGVASWDGQEAAAGLVARADAALYTAKREGRNRTTIG